MQRRRWLSDDAFAELVALCQFLPGPTSSQLGMAVGLHRAGRRGALAAWVGFTLPSVLLMAGFAVVGGSGAVTEATWLDALRLVAVVVVADAVLGMGRRLTATAPTLATAAATAATVLLLTEPWAAPGCLLVAGGVGAALLRPGRPVGEASGSPLPVGPATSVGACLLGAFSALMVAALVLAPSSVLGTLAAATYRAGALVFGGGHVVLPLLETEVVPDLLNQQAFLAGYGAAQAVPGPLFSFASYVGQVAGGLPGAVVATLGIFLPGTLLLLGVLPFWARLRANASVGAALVGVNVAVVGVLAAALVDPIVAGSIGSWVDAAFAGGLFLLLRVGGLPPIAVVAVAVVASPVLGLG